jgi:Protein of unknown function (DUF1353)
MDRRPAAIALVAIVFFLCAFFQTPPAPLVRPFGDNADWVTAEDMVYTIGATTEKIVVPKGFVTDFASIPRPLWSLGLSPHGQYSRAAVIHDFLYWAQGCSRTQSGGIDISSLKSTNRVKIAFMHAGQSIVEAMWDLLETF